MDFGGSETKRLCHRMLSHGQKEFTIQGRQEYSNTKEHMLSNNLTLEIINTIGIQRKENHQS